MKEITSTTNPKIKWVRSLHKNSTRKKEGVFLVEGAKEIAYAIEGGFMPQSFFLSPEICKEAPLEIQTENFFTVTRAVYEKIAYRSDTEGLLAVFKTKTLTLDDLNFGENPFFIILESVEKPGNLGAVIRTADGAGADAVIICDSKCDAFNPNVIRSSVGTSLIKQVVAASNQEVYDFLEKHEITAYGALLNPQAQTYTQINYETPTALILGTEHEGLSDFWQQRTQPISIPMHGINDSLNVSNAAAILAYEVARQRMLSD